MENGRGTGRSPHAQPNPRRRAWALAAGIAVVAAAVALAIAELGGGGLPAAQRLAGNFAHAWSKRDWRALYRDLDARAHSALPFSTFVAIERGDADLATTASAVVGAPSALAGGRVSVPVTVGTRIFGTLDERFVLTITGPSSSLRRLSPGTHRPPSPDCCPASSCAASTRRPRGASCWRATGARWPISFRRRT